jgi:hemolysin III
VAVVSSPAPAPPRLRGVSHEKAFAFAPALALLLVASAEGPRATTAAAFFGVTMAAMLGASAANHRAVVSYCWLPWLRRLDHTAINLFLAGTWTSFALVLVSGTTRLALSAIVWGGAVAASLVTIVWVAVPGWIPATIGLATGWSAVVVIPDLAAAVGPVGAGLFLLGGLLYTAGAIAYALERPNPFPSTIGYHEIFHALVLAGATCHYLTHALFVLPFAA